MFIYFFLQKKLLHKYIRITITLLFIGSRIIAQNKTEFDALNARFEYFSSLKHAQKSDSILQLQQNWFNNNKEHITQQYMFQYQLLLNQSKTSILNAHYEEAKFNALNALNIVKEKNNDTLKIQPYYELAGIYKRLGNLKLAFESNKKGILISKENGLINKEIDGYLELGYLFFPLGEVDSTLHYNRKAQNLLKNNRPVTKLALLAQEARCLSLKNNILEARKKFFQILDSAKKLKIEQGKTSIYFQIASTYAFEDDYINASAYFKKALESCNNKADSLAILVSYGGCLRGTDQKELGTKILEDFVQNPDAHLDPENLIVAKLNLANIYYEKKDYNSSFQMYDEVEEYCIQKQLNQKLTYLYANKANIYFEIDSLTRSRSLFLKSIEYAKKYGPIGVLEDNYLMLSELAQKENKPLEALKFYKQFHTISDSIRKEKLSIEINKLKTQTELSEKNQQLQNTEIQLANQKERKHRLIFTLILSSLLVIILILLLTINKQKNKLQKNQISKQNTQIKALKKEIEKKSSYDKLDIKELVKKDFVTFLIEFEKLFPEFIPTLKNEHQNLTKNDIRLCTLIKLGLTNKEVAELLNISYDGLKTAKKRLKKRMNILDTDLDSFIQNI